MNMTPKEYNRYVARLAKKSPLGKDLLNSFLIGGLICVVGHLGQPRVFERCPDGPERL